MQSLTSNRNFCMSNENIGLKEIEQIENRSYKVIKSINDFRNKPRELPLRFTITQASEMVGRSAQAIRDGESCGKLRTGKALKPDLRRRSYTLEDINIMREYFGTLPWRNSETDEPIIMSVQTFKGGSGKSTLSTHFSQNFALQGYRVLIVDLDPQASTTALFGLNPDQDIDSYHTLENFFFGSKPNLKYAVRNTHWPQLDLIAANLELYNVEYQIASMATMDNSVFLRLGIGLKEIAKDYDIVIIDAPPALGMISISILNAANALLVPCRPSVVDFTSTANFFTMVKQVYESLIQKNIVQEPRYKFLKIVANAKNENKKVHQVITDMMRKVYGHQMLDTIIKDSTEIDNACSEMMTMFELNTALTSRKTRQRGLAYLEAAAREIEIEIMRSWPSKQEILRSEGLL